MFFFDHMTILVYLYIYLFFYNLSIFVIFVTIMNYKNPGDSKTNNIFSHLSNGKFRRNLVLIPLFSLAGIPPFIGFFLKLKLISIIGFISFLKLFFLIAPSILLLLFFYVQSMRYIFLNKEEKNKYDSIGESESSVLFSYLILLILFLLSIGFIIISDIFVFFIWLSLF